MGWKSRFFCDFVKFWPLGWKSGFFCDFVGFWPLKKCSICFLAPTLFDTVGFEVAPKGRPGGIRASDLQAPSPNCLVVHPLDLPKIPKSKIQNPQNPKIQNSKIKKSKISKIPKSKIQNPKIPNPKPPKSQNPKSKTPKSKSKIPKIPKSKIQNPKIPNPKSPKSQNPKSPKSKIQTFLAGFWGFWILDFGSLCSNSLREAPNAPNFGFWRRILDFGFWILGILDFGDFGFWGFWILGSLDFGFWGRNPKSKIHNPKSPKSKIPKIRPKELRFWDLGILEILGILDFGFWGFWILGIVGFWILGILDFGFWGNFGDFGFWIFGILGILDFGFLEHYVADLYVQSLDFGFWGFWGFWILGILDFGFWILDFGDLGFWILDWGFWMGTLWQNFGCYIRKEDCARRTGSADSLLKICMFSSHLFLSVFYHSFLNGNFMTSVTWGWWKPGVVASVTNAMASAGVLIRWGIEFFRGSERWGENVGFCKHLLVYIHVHHGQSTWHSPQKVG